MHAVFKKPKHENLIALAAAVCLFLSSIEYIIPKPLPFIRLGLANLPILVVLSILSPIEVFMLILLKILGQSLIQGTLFSHVFLFSFSGSLAAGIVMIFAYRLLNRWISLIGISILGAFTSNIIQILLARIFIFGDQAWIIAPPFLLMGLISSTLLGFTALIYKHKSTWIKKLEKEIHTIS